MFSPGFSNKQFPVFPSLLEAIRLKAELPTYTMNKETEISLPLKITKLGTHNELNLL